MVRALTPTPHRATPASMASRRVGAPLGPSLEVAGAVSTAAEGLSTPTATALACEARLAAERLRPNAERLGLLTLRIIRPETPSQRAGSLTLLPPLDAPADGARSPTRTQTRRASANAAVWSDWSDALTALAARLRPLIRHSDTLMVACDGIAILLCDPAPAGARIVAQRLRATLLDERRGATSAFGAQTGDATPRTTLLLGVGHGACDINGIAVNENVGDDQNTPINVANIPAALLATSRAAPRVTSAIFNARFATLFAHAWETSAAIPIILTHVAGADDAAPRDEAKAAQTETMLRRQATALGVPYARLPSPLPINCRRAISRELASELRAVPIGYAHAKLTMAMEHPGDTQSVERLRQATGHTIFPVLAAADDISRAIKQLRS